MGVDEGVDMVNIAAAEKAAAEKAAAEAVPPGDGPPEAAGEVPDAYGGSLPGLWDYPLTDLGNARRLVRAFGDEVRFLAGAKRWLAWDDRRWGTDDTGQVHRLARRVVDAMVAAPVVAMVAAPDAMAAGPVPRSPATGPADDAASRTGPADDAALGDAREWALAEAEAVRLRAGRARRDFARRSQSRARLEAMVALAECEPGVPVRPADMDADPWLLCARNGTVDLTTGLLRPHRRSDLITRLAPVDYDPEAPCPLWEAALARLLPDPAVRGFVRRSAGYALTGSVREQCVFVWHGAGRNGKTTVLEALRAVLGDYAVETPAETLTARAGGGGVPSDVARLAGARLVTARETEDGQRLAEAVLKQLSGGDTVTARFLFHEWFEFRPALKLFLATNHLPQARGADEGLWRRIHVVPFGQTLAPGEVDRDLPERLRAEAAGILAWAVRGCLEWRRGGLDPPPAVAASTAAYRRDSDAVGRFVDERCEVRAGLSQPAGPLQAAFASWAREGMLPPVGPQEFSRRLAGRGLTKTRRGGGWVWEGLALVGGGPR